MSDDTALNPEDAALVASETAKKVKQEQPGITLKPGDVVSIDATGLSQYMTAFVHVDGDDPSNTTHAVSLIGTVSVGARVMVAFVPPHGVYLIGVLFGDCDLESITFTAFGEVTADPSPPWPPPEDVNVVEIVTMCLTPASTDSTVSIAVAGTEVFSYVFPAGTSTLVLDKTDVGELGLAEDAQVNVTITPGSGLEDCTVTLRWCPGAASVPEECDCPLGCCDGDDDCGDNQSCVDGCCEDNM